MYIFIQRRKHENFFKLNKKKCSVKSGEEEVMDTQAKISLDTYVR